MKCAKRRTGIRPNLTTGSISTAGSPWLLATLAAIAVANSPLSPYHRDLLDMVGEIRVGSLRLAKNLGR